VSYTEINHYKFFFNSFNEITATSYNGERAFVEL